MKNKNRMLRLKRVCFGGVWMMILMLSNGCTIRLNGDFCDVYLPVYPDYEKDTPETIRQIDKNNIVYQQCLIGKK